MPCNLASNFTAFFLKWTVVLLLIIGVFTSTGGTGYKGIRVTFCNVFKWRKATLIPLYPVTPALVNTLNNLFQHMVEQAFLIFYSAGSTTKLLCFQLIQFIQDVKFKERSFLKDFFDLLLRAIHNSGLNFLPGNMEIGAC